MQLPKNVGMFLRYEKKNVSLCAKFKLIKSNINLIN